MPHRRATPTNKLPLSHSTKINVESCPNSILISSETKEKDLLRSKRNRKLESSPVLQISNDDKRTTASMANISKVGHTAPNTPECYLQVKGTPQTSSDRMKAYIQAPDNMLQQYTLMSYSSGPLMSSLYPNYNVSMPYLPHYSGYSIHNIPKGTVQSQLKEKTTQPLYQDQSFPSFFNPRTASNMPHKEKVNNWIENIPVFEVENGLWETECYDTNYSIDWEEHEFDCRSFNETNKISFVTHDELLFLQAKKFETVVRKLYKLEGEPAFSDKDFLLDTNSLTDYL